MYFPNAAELHLHIEGTLEPELLLRLAKRNKVNLGTTSLAALKERYNFNNLQDFLNLYYDSMKVLQTEEDFYELATEYFAKASMAGVVKVEAFFDPQTHIENGVAFQTVVDGLTRAFRESAQKFFIESRLIMCFERDRGQDEALKLLDTYSSASNTDLIIGVGLDSAEYGYPPSNFYHAFERAKSLGLHLTAHAGEEGGPDYIWQALDLLHVERIDHGVRCLEDPRLVARLVAEQTPITVCPLSNIALKVSPNINEHPIHRMLELGLNVSVNSDDPAYFGGYLDANFTALQRAGIDATGLAQLEANSLKAAWF